MKVTHITPEENNQETLTLIKVGNKDYWPSPKDLETLRDVVEGKLDPKNIKGFENIDIDIENINVDADHKLMIVKVGSENYEPTIEDLETWRKIFEEAKYDKDFKVFTHAHINIDVIDLKKSKVVVL